MRLFEVIETEGWSDEQLISFIRKNCSRWLDETEGKPFYRGQRGRGTMLNDYAMIHGVRDERKPKDTSPEVTEVFNAAIKMAGGVANRTNSAFITEDYDRASVYGTTYAVFPVGNDYHYTYKVGMGDWFDQMILSGGLHEHLIKETIAEAYLREYPYEIQTLTDMNLYGMIFDNINQTMSIPISYVDPDGNKFEYQRLAILFESDMVDISSLADEIIVDKEIEYSDGEEIMLHPKSKKILLVDVQYYDNILRGKI